MSKAYTDSAIKFYVGTIKDFTTSILYWIGIISGAYVARTNTESVLQIGIEMAIGFFACSLFMNGITYFRNLHQERKAFKMKSLEVKPTDITIHLSQNEVKIIDAEFVEEKSN